MAFVSLLVLVYPAVSQQGNKVLLIIRDVKVPDPPYMEWAITKEANVIKEMLQKAGYAVEIASPSGATWTTPTAVLKPDHKLSDVKVADYKGFVIPCLAIDSMDLHPDLAAVIKAAVENGKPIAAQTGAVAILAKAGVLSGKKYAVAGDATIPELGSGIYSGTGVVKDGKIITSGVCPTMARMFKGMQDGTPELTKALIAELKQTK